MIEKLVDKAVLSSVKKVAKAYPQIANKRCVDVSAAELAKLMKRAFAEIPVDGFVKKSAPVAVKAKAKEALRGMQRVAQFFNGKSLVEFMKWGQELKGLPAMFTKKGKLTAAAKKTVIEGLAEKGLTPNATIGQSIKKGFNAFV